MKRISIVVPLLGCLAAVFYSVSGALAPKPEKAPFQGQRFLFIVDVSDSMKRLEHDGRQALFDMIYTGLDGYMRQGDTFGLWTFNDTVSAGVYPMQVWRTNELLHLATQASFFVKDVHYKKRSNMKDALAKALSVVSAIQDLHIIFISDENARMEGITFDEQINRRYEELALEVRSRKQPILTTLLAEEGKIKQARVILPGEPFELPYRPDPMPNPEPDNPIASGKPTSVAPKLSSARSIVISGGSKDPVTGESQVVVQVDSIHQSTVTTQRSEMTISGPRAPEASAILSTPPGPETSGIEPAVRPLGEAPSKTSPNAPPTQRPNEASGLGAASPDASPSVTRALASIHPKPTSVVARESEWSAAAGDGNTNAPAVGLTALGGPVSAKGTSLWTWWVSGAGCLLAAFGLVVVFVRLHRRTQQPSVITQSLCRR